MAHAPHSANRDPSFTARSRSTWEIIRRVAVYLRPYKWMALGNIACAVLSLAFALTYPQLTRLVIDQVIGEKQTRLLAPVMLGLLVAFLLRDLFNSLREHFNPQQMVELTAAIAWENFRARFNRGFGIEAEGFTEGAACPLQGAKT